MTQIEVENNTPYRRRIFVHPVQMSPKEPIPMMLTAWKHFDLGPGESIGTMFGNLRVGARVSRGSVLDHRTVVADAQFGDIWTFRMDDGVPAFQHADNAPHNSVQVQNALSGPNAAPILVTFYWDYSPWMTFDVSPGAIIRYAFMNQVFAYASMPIVDDSSALVIEPPAGKFVLANPGMRLQLMPSPDGTTIEWMSAATHAGEQL